MEVPTPATNAEVSSRSNVHVVTTRSRYLSGCIAEWISFAERIEHLVKGNSCKSLFLIYVSVAFVSEYAGSTIIPD